MKGANPCGKTHRSLNSLSMHNFVVKLAALFVEFIARVHEQHDDRPYS